MEITFKNLWDWIVKGIALILVIAVVFGVGAFAYSKYFVDPMYVSGVKFYASGMETAPTLGQSVAPQYVEFLNVNEFYEMVAKDLLADTGVNMTPAEVAKLMKFSSVVEDTSSFFVSVQASDPNLAYNVALSVAEMAPERVDGFADVGELNVIENPTLPSAPVGAGALQTAIVGTIVGFLVGALLVVLRELLDNRIKTPDEITQTFGIPVFGIVPDFSASEKKGGR